MRKMVQWVTAAAMSAGTFAWVSNANAADPVENKVDRAVDNTKEAGRDVKDAAKDAGRDAKAGAKDAKDNWNTGRTYTTLSQVTNAALTKGGFDDMIERFVDADRNRLGKWAKDDANKDKLAVLDGRIEQFHKDWKAKYGHDFKIQKDDVVFGNAPFTVALGEIGKDAQVAGQKLPPAENVTKDNLNKPKDDTGNTAADRNLEHGRNVAYVTVAASHGMPELKVPMIHELPNSYRIDVPDNIDGQMLYLGVLKHLTMANEMKDKWPSDETEAYRAVAHHVLMGVMGVDDKDAGKATGKLGGDTVKTTDDKK